MNMNIQIRIRDFNRSNVPFYLVDHETGQYSLCLALNFMGREYTDFGQAAFNRYAQQIGAPVMKQGLYTYGSGYEWELVFKKAFEHSPDLEKIEFDSEASGFFCISENLPLLEEFGSRFRTMVMDTEGFAQLVSTTLAEAAEQDVKRDEQLLPTEDSVPVMTM